MRESFFNLMSIIITAAVIENLIFARAIGTDNLMASTKNYRAMTRFGIMVCLISCVGATIAWGFAYFFQDYAWWQSAKGVAVLFGVSAAYLALAFLLDYKKKTFASGLLVAASYNGAAFAAALLSINESASLAITLAYCAGYSVGLVFALMLVHSGRERLEICRVPKSFSGLPITLIYIGVLSLAIYGLIGHQLPT